MDRALHEMLHSLARLRGDLEGTDAAQAFIGHIPDKISWGRCSVQDSQSVWNNISACGWPSKACDKAGR